MEIRDDEEPNQNGSMLIIQETMVDDSGLYVCRVENVAGNAAAVFNVTVFSEFKHPLVTEFTWIVLYIIHV